MTLANILNTSLNDVKGQVYTMTIGELIEVDRELNRAKVVRLIDEAQESKYIDKDDEYIYDIPFVTMRTRDFVFIPPYQAGDRVVILFSHRDITNILDNKGAQADNANFDKSDAVIVGTINLFDEPINLGESNDGDIVLKKHDDSLSVKIDGDNNIEIKTDGNIYLGDKNEAEPMPLGRQLKEWLDNHTHDYDWTDSGGSSTTKPPKVSSPPLSEGVHNS